MRQALTEHTASHARGARPAATFFPIARRTAQAARKDAGQNKPLYLDIRQRQKDTVSGSFQKQWLLGTSCSMLEYMEARISNPEASVLLEGLGGVYLRVTY